MGTQRCRTKIEMTPTTVDWHWQLKWEGLGGDLFVLLLFLFIQKQFQQVNWDIGHLEV